MNREQIKEWSKSKLKGNLWTVLCPILLISVIQGIGGAIGEKSSIVYLAIVLFLTIFEVGLTAFMINFITDKECNVDQLWSKLDKGGKIIGTYIIAWLKVFLWTLLLIVPGIIKGFKLAMIPYILVDDKDMSSSDILDLSEKMMDGHKMDLFVLQLSFIGWHILSLFTLFILEIWVMPYQKTAETKFMNDIKLNYEKEHGITNVNDNSQNINNNDTSSKFCTSCGNKLEQDAAFCPNCGTQSK